MTQLVQSLVERLAQLPEPLLKRSSLPTVEKGEQFPRVL